MNSLLISISHFYSLIFHLKWKKKENLKFSFKNSCPSPPSCQRDMTTTLINRKEYFKISTPLSHI